MKAKFISFEQFKNEKNIDYIILYSYKVFPRFLFNYLKDKFYIYCYLDPFECYLDHNKILKAETSFNTWYFAYKPFYIGKGSTSRGYRMNQHLNNFIKDKKDNNLLKQEYFKEIEKKMKKSNSIVKDWNDYKNSFIVTLISFNNENDLLACEIELINVLGTIYKQDGILTNKIITYKGI